MKGIIVTSLMFFSSVFAEETVCGKIKKLKLNSLENEVVIAGKSFIFSESDMLIGQALISARASNAKVCATFYPSSDGKNHLSTLNY